VIGDYSQQVDESVIGGIPTILEVYYRCLFRKLGRTLLEGSVRRILVNPMRHRVDNPKVNIDI
jgi:hypothetical protein